MLTFKEWLEHWGEDRLTEKLQNSQMRHHRMWENSQNPNHLWSYPVWELCLGNYWQEQLDEWHCRWLDCGGKLSKGRMIASKWDTIWERLSHTFYDGLGFPYPPYARSSCAFWSEIDQDEAIISGAISESEFNDYMAQFKQEPRLLLDKDGKPISTELIQSILHELEEEIYRNGGPHPDATRQERVAHERKQSEESFARLQEEYEQRQKENNCEREEQNSVFRLLEQVEESLRDSPSVKDSRRWEWLCKSLNTLTTINHFTNYPDWRARAWIACAEMYAQSSDSSNELLCLEHALQINDKLPIKRRIRTLKQQNG